MHTKCFEIHVYWESYFKNLIDHFTPQTDSEMVALQQSINFPIFGSHLGYYLDGSHLGYHLDVLEMYKDDMVSSVRF